MKILAIETATDACSAALLIDNHISTVFELAPRKHTQLILGQIEQLLIDADISLNTLDAVAFGCGPGAFTGLRIAAGVTQGLALAADIPAIAVSTLAAMAQQAYQRYQIEKCYVALDARMEQVYWGKYQINAGFTQLQSNEQVISPSDIAKPDTKGFAGIGSGWLAYADDLAHVDVACNQTYQKIQPSAEQVAELAVSHYQKNNLLFSEQIQPVYLRNKVAQTLIERGK